MSASSLSRCELTETYSPAAIDIAPATRPATPASSTACLDAADAAMPIIRLEVDTMASSAPRTAARNHLPRTVRCGSPCEPGDRERATTNLAVLGSVTVRG